MVTFHFFVLTKLGATEPSQDYFLKAIHAFPGKILFLNGEKEKRTAETKFAAATAGSRIHVIKGNSGIRTLRLMF